MSVAVDMPIQHIDGRRGRLIAVRSEPCPINLSTTPAAWAILVVVGGRFEEWRALDCQTAPPAAAPVPPAVRR